MANYSKNKKYHFTYKTTNLVNGRYYLGMHSTNRLDDGYLGSGTRLYRELSKYGRDSFKLEILEYFNTRDELIEGEKSLITEQDLNNENCLNLKPGGSGGWTSEEHQKKATKNANIKRIDLFKNSKEFRDKWYKSTSKIQKELARDPNHTFKKYRDGFRGKTHSQETKSKISDALRGKGRGVNNSQYGTCWITNEEQNKKIHRGDLIPEGWRLGRVLNKK